MSNSSINIQTTEFKGNNLGTGTTIYDSVNPFNTLNFKTLVGAGAISVVSGTSEVTISASTASGEANTGTNVGTGAQIYKDNLGTALRFKTLLASGSVGITTVGDEIFISAGTEALAAGNITEIQFNNSTGNTLGANSGFTFIEATQSFTLGNRSAGTEGKYSLSQGNSNKAIGDYSHAGGQSSTACGYASFSHGNTNSALAPHSAILGGCNNNIAIGNDNAVVIGGNAIDLTGTSYIDTTAVDNLALMTVPTSGSSDQVLIRNISTGVVEYVSKASLGGGGGGSTTACNGLSINGSGDVVLGGTLTGDTLVDTANAFGIAFGFASIASGSNSIAEGCASCAVGNHSHAEGNKTKAIGLGSHSEGFCTCANGTGGHSEGAFTCSYGFQSHSEGRRTVASGYYSHAEGKYSCASGTSSHAEGNQTCACGSASHAEGNITKAYGIGSHAEGSVTRACGLASHAEGVSTHAIGNRSHSEGSSTRAYGAYSHAEGTNTFSYGRSSHSQNENTKACGDFSHAGGLSCQVGTCVIAVGEASFNHSINCSGGQQTVGHGALAQSSAILGGFNHNIESGNTGATIIGGNTIKLTGSTYVDHTAVDKLAIMTPPNVTTDADLLTWNATTGKVGYIAKNDVSITSDARLKTCVEEINNVDLTAICGVSFMFNELTPQHGTCAYGVIAQDVQKVFPLAVKDEGIEHNGKLYKTVDYNQLTPILLNKIKELEERIKELEK